TNFSSTISIYLALGPLVNPISTASYIDLTIKAVPLVPELSRGDLKEIILLDEWNLYCFQGKHRITATCEYDTWCIFNLYNTEKLSDNYRRRLRECDSRSYTFSDREIFRSIRHY
ncbi:hypothetical protein N7524_008746, partial [Penicillium chrysogenum]